MKPSQRLGRGLPGLERLGRRIGLRHVERQRHVAAAARSGSSASAACESKVSLRAGTLKLDMPDRTGTPQGGRLRATACGRLRVYASVSCSAGQRGRQVFGKAIGSGRTRCHP